MEFFQLEKSLQNLVLEQTRQALYGAILSINKNFSSFIKFYDFSKEELLAEESTITTLLERAIGKYFSKNFNDLSSISGIVIDPQKHLANRGKDYLLLIPKKIRRRKKDAPMHIEQKLNIQKGGVWTGSKHSKKCNVLLLIEIGKIDYNKGIVEFWAGIFDKTKAKQTTWKGSNNENSGSTKLRINIDDLKCLYVLIGELNLKNPGRGPKRKNIKPVYFKVN